MAKRGAVRILREKMKRNWNKELNWKWTDQFRWCRPAGYASTLKEELSQVVVTGKEDRLRLDIARALLTIPEQLLVEETQGQDYDTWNVILNALGFSDEMKLLLIEKYSDRTGEKDEWEQFHIDWTAIREGDGLVLLGTKTMKIRYEVLYLWCAYLLGKVEED